jgi:hypothetical protein
MRRGHLRTQVKDTTSMTALSLPMLVTVAGNVVVWDNLVLTSVSLPLLTTRSIGYSIMVSPPAIHAQMRMDPHHPSIYVTSSSSYIRKTHHTQASQGHEPHPLDMPQARKACSPRAQPPAIHSHLGTDACNLSTIATSHPFCGPHSFRRDG